MSLLDKLVSKAYAAPQDVFGTIQAPQGVEEFNKQTNIPGGIGIIIFASNMIRFISVAAGIFVLFNFVTAGLSLVAGGGKADKYTEATNKITMSAVGIMLIVASYTIAGVIGLIVFGDWTYIINPKICGPAGCP